MSYNYCDIYLSHLDKAILTKVRIPNSFYHNAKGLLGEKHLKEDTGMLFKKCSSIHMIGMKMPLDILFLAKDGTVLKCVNNLQPWKIAACFKASTTLELASGSIKKLGLIVGTKLEIKECKNQE